MNEKFKKNFHNELLSRRDVWNKKKVLRQCYFNWYNMIKPYVKDGITLEVGAGSGLVKEFWEGKLVTTDILKSKWVDHVMDAHCFGFKDTSLDNILGIDVLHHLHTPEKFFYETIRALKYGGKLILIEPWISPVSYFFYKLCHHEKISFKQMSIDEKNPWDGNMAIPNIFFSPKDNFLKHYEQFEFETFEKFSFFDYQFAGGFKPWSIIKNETIFEKLLKFDKKLSFLMPLIAFRVFIVLKKK